MKYEKFWAVWRHSGGGSPNHRHASKELALTEAQRLATTSGEPYYVLEVIGVVAPKIQPIEYIEI